MTYHLLHVRYIFSQRRPAQPFPPLTATMTTQGQSMGHIPMSGEIGQEML
jgi:hypothetical protein